jgi:hypothetical protein
MAKVEFNEYEVQLVRFFAKFYTDEGRYCPFGAIPGYKEDRAKFGAAFDRLSRFNFAKGHTSGSLEVLPKCLEEVEAWDNPPVPDRWDEATKWLRSKRWSLPLLVVGVGLPLIKGYWDLITLILGYIYPASKK